MDIFPPVQPDTTMLLEVGVVSLSGALFVDFTTEN